ncbi:MAG: ABC transporter substrate-binding protein [Treponema sp.]|nr:ABC transporter substrate-binding protein [Treponema sp.]
MKIGVLPVIVFFVLSVFLMAVSCSKSDDGAASRDGKTAVTITYFTSQGSMHEYNNKMARRLKENENIEVEFQVVPDDQYYTLAKTKLATNEVPDIIEYNTPSNNIELNVQENCIPLDNEEWFPRLVNPELLRDPRDGKVYAMPLTSSSTFLAWYFNKTKLEEMEISTGQPRSYADFLARCEEIKQKGNGEVAPIVMAAADSWTVQIYPVVGEMMVMYPNEREICAKLERNELQWNRIPEFLKVMEDMAALKDLGYLNKDFLSTTFDMSKEKVARGEAIMALQTESFPQDIAAKFPDIEMGSWICNYQDKMILPIGAYVRGLFVPKKGKHPDEARRFLNLWSQPEYQNIHFQDLPGLPPFKDGDGGEMLDCVRRLVDTYVPANQYSVNMNDILSTPSPIYPQVWLMYVDMLSGGLTPRELMDQWQGVYEDYMKELGMPGF